MQTGWFSQFNLILTQGLRAELADRERLVSPALFAITVLLLFSFAVGEVEPDLKIRFYLAETFLTAFFALQLAFSRIFEPDRQDRVFDVMRTRPILHSAWFAGKYCVLLLVGIATLLPTMLIAAFLNNDPNIALFSWMVCAIAVLALGGLAAIGLVLSVVTMKSNARQILYPLLYFPLTVPVLIAALQASQSWYTGTGDADAFTNWITLLISFDTIYFTLGILLFGELLDDT